MADKPINLRLRRKQKARDDKRKRADTATAATGISRQDRETSAKLTQLDTKRLDGHRLEQPKDDDA